MVRIDLGVADGIHMYVHHRARLVLDSRRALLIKFWASPTYTLMCREFVARKAALRRRRAVVFATKRLRDRGEVQLFSAPESW
jgi:hypothetical protein